MMQFDVDERARDWFCFLYIFFNFIFVRGYVRLSFSPGFFQSDEDTQSYTQTQTNRHRNTQHSHTRNVENAIFYKR